MGEKAGVPESKRVWTPEGIALAIARCADSGNAQDLRFLLKGLETADRDRLFDDLFTVIVGGEPALTERFRCQQIAGALLLLLHPPCPYPIETVIERVIEPWNVSVFAIPWYLAEVFGKDTVLDAVNGLLLEPPDECAQSKIATIRYWVVPFRPGIGRVFFSRLHSPGVGWGGGWSIANAAPDSQR